MSYLREQNVDIVFEKVKELQKFEQKRIDKFKKNL
jgi:filamentation induced by cAMP protein fic